jgi:hypothetical protein
MAIPPEVLAARQAFHGKVRDATASLTLQQLAESVAYAWGEFIKAYPSKWDAEMIPTITAHLASYVAAGNREAVYNESNVGGETPALQAKRQATFLNAVKTKAATFVESEEEAGPNWMLLVGGAAVAYFLFMKKK